MNQEPFDFGRLYRLEEEFKNSFRSTSDAVDSIGLGVAAGAAGMEPPDLNKTFRPNSDRHLRLRTVMAIGATASPDHRRLILEPVARLFGFELQVERPMDDKEARLLAESALRSLGPIGVAALHAAYGGRK